MSGDRRLSIWVTTVADPILVSTGTHHVRSSYVLYMLHYQKDENFVDPDSSQGISTEVLGPLLECSGAQLRCDGVRSAGTSGGKGTKW